MENKLFNSGNYYNLFYKDKNYLAEAKYVDNILKKFNIPGNKILELGCGTGKHSRHLSEIGYKILGIERSQSMIDSVMETLNFKCKKGDITNFKLKNSFDAVISLFHVISYQVSNENLKKVFKNSFNHLNNNGIFLFDVWFGPAVIHQKPEVRVKKIKTNKSTIIRIAEPDLIINKNQVNIKYTYYESNTSSKKFKITQETHPMRYFTIPELEYIAEGIGFKLLNVEEFLTAKEPSFESWGICLIFKKNG